MLDTHQLYTVPRCSAGSQLAVPAAVLISDACMLSAGPPAEAQAPSWDTVHQNGAADDAELQFHEPEGAGLQPSPMEHQQVWCVSVSGCLRRVLHSPSADCFLHLLSTAACACSSAAEPPYRRDLTRREARLQPVPAIAASPSQYEVRLTMLCVETSCRGTRQSMHAAAVQQWRPAAYFSARATQRLRCGHACAGAAAEAQGQACTHQQCGS